MTDILNIKVNDEWVGIPAIKGDNGQDGKGVPTGGTTGQFLTKKTNTDYDTEWQTLDALPTQTGQSGKYLTTDGSSASWGSVSIPTVNDATLTITQGGITKGTFTANASSDATIELEATSTAWGSITGTLSSQTDLDTALSGKADINLSNVNNTGTSTGASWAMPSNTYDDLTLGASGTEYTAPANGWFAFNYRVNSTSGIITAINTTSGNISTVCRPQASENLLYINIPAKKGDKVAIYYEHGSSNTSSNIFRFIYAVGSESEAS